MTSVEEYKSNKIVESQIPKDEIKEVSPMPARIANGDRKPRILFVDDDESIRDLMELHFQTKGLEAVFAVDGVDALGKFKKDSFDVVFTDRTMPRMDGDRLVPEIRRIDPHVRIVMASGRNISAEDKARINADVYVEKPFRLSEIDRLLRQFGVLRDTV